MQQVSWIWPRMWCLACPAFASKTRSIDLQLRRISWRQPHSMVNDEDNIEKNLFIRQRVLVQQQTQPSRQTPTKQLCITSRLAQTLRACTSSMYAYCGYVDHHLTINDATLYLINTNLMMSADKQKRQLFSPSIDPLSPQNLDEHRI